MIEEIRGFFSANGEMIIALCALALSIQQARASRRHERLSVRPYLTFDRIFKLEDGLIQLVLENKGQGPAFISSVVVSLDGKVRDSTANIWHLIGAELELPLKSGGGTLLGTGDILAPMSSLILAEFKSVGPLLGYEEQVDNILHRLVVKIDYSSKFGEAFGVLSTFPTSVEKLS